MKKPVKKKPTKELTVEQKITRRSFISFATFAAAGTALYGGWRWLYHSAREVPGITGGAKKPLRRALNQTELFFRKIASKDHQVKTYPKYMAARHVRVNSLIGLKDEAFRPDKWMLSIVMNKGDLLQLSIDEILRLPKTEIIFDFKCVEGWDQIQHWGGVRMIDLVEHYKLNNLAAMQYMGLATPDNKYYVGLDMDSAMHPQTILAYEMNGKQLTPEHGAPLRLIIPVKYGIKNLKRIGTISFSDTRPPDYWAERGYDYYSGL
uniref:Molybdopterin binding oxidoreductase n=1 Tax=uncultured bacterium BLR12 TaxID=506514 RepID=C0IND7_9BACT|nr:molybdopterin binding oxidoreductase [uncultured bacterium BLR12]